jgi:hypothetical protein
LGWGDITPKISPFNRYFSIKPIIFEYRLVMAGESHNDHLAFMSLGLPDRLVR